MKKIMSTGILALFIAILSSPAKKNYIVSEQRTYFQTNNIADAPDLKSSPKIEEINYIYTFNQASKSDSVQNRTADNQGNLSYRHRKGKMIYIKEACDIKLK